MVDKSLVEYIKKVRKLGLSDEEVKQKLVTMGRHEEEVENVMKHLKTVKFEEIGGAILGVILLIGFVGMYLNEIPETEQVVNMEQMLSDSELIDLAIENKDASFCNQLTNPVSKQICELEVSGDTNSDESTIINDAIESGDADNCELLENPVERQICLGEVIEAEETEEDKEQEELFDVVQQTGNAALCSQLTNPVERQICELESQ